jgi:hypothetical protein
MLAGITRASVRREERAMRPGCSYLVSSLALLAAISVVPPAKAEDAATDGGYRALVAIFKPTSPPTFTASKCDISLTADFDDYRNHISAIREEWLYKDRSTEFYQRHAYKVLYTVARKEATMITQGMYMRPEVNLCHFRLLIADQDKFGNDRPYVLLSWSFTRELANKTHWDNLDDKHFPDLAVDYRFGQEFLARAKREPLE